MVFGIEKYAMLILKNGKRLMREGMELPNQEKIRTPREKSYKYLTILEVDIIKQVEIKHKRICQENVKSTRNQTK